MALAIYGAGLYGRTFLDGLQQMGVTVDFFIDQYSSQLEIKNIPILRLDAVKNPAEVTVLVSVALNDDSEVGQAMIKNLQKAGFARVLNFVASCKAYSALLPQFANLKLLWITPDLDQRLNLEQLAVLEQLLADDVSKALLQRIVAFRRDFAVEHYVEPDGQTEYFPNDVPWQLPGQALRFVDAGAYIGDTVKGCVSACQHTGQQLDWIASFEPDMGNIAEYQQEIKRQMFLAPDAQFMLYTSGVWDRDGILSFSSEGSSSSSIVADTNEQGSSIAVNALDSVLFGAKPNYIKLDVEGAELAALTGAQQLIQQYSPQLAVCIYHKPADLWELPLFIHSINPNYDFYLRMHGHMGLSTVLYCIPKTPG